MAYSDPTSLTNDGTAVSLPRVMTGTTVGRFVAADAAHEVTIDPRSTAARRRNVARYYRRRTGVDPQVPTLTTQFQSMVSVTIDRPRVGTTDAEIEKDLVALIGWLTANTNANLKKLVAGEN